MGKRTRDIPETAMSSQHLTDSDDGSEVVLSGEMD